MDLNNFYNNVTQTVDSNQSGRLTLVMRQVFLKMTLGLIVSALAAMFAATSGVYLNFLSAHTGVIWILFLLEIGLVLAISGAINKLSSTAASLLFYLFAVVNGLALTPIFYIYTASSIFKTFFISSGVFGAMTIYGYFTTKDLTRIGTFLIMALFGLIIVSIANFFFHGSALEFGISAAGVLIFIGLTAWDTQRIKQMALYTPDESLGKVATIGALNLYLDFINLFIYLLRLLGNRN